MKIFNLLVLIVGYVFSVSVFAETDVTNASHEALATYHESIVKEAELKLAEHKQNLEDYEEHSHYYGRQGQDFQSHEKANIEYYEEVIHENLKIAELHKRMASEQNDSIKNANVDNSNVIMQAAN
ncbi:MAG: hypothetical protein IPI97_10810 [Nitrosomonas sp.]|jgi:hypothetical protein|nr:hypothetical protein [Nitrosomonas sp.]